MIYAGILAGGVGHRMGYTAMPKQFLNVGGKPIIIHTIEKFMLCGRFEHIYVAVVRDYVEHTRDLIAKYIGETDRVSVITGGADRNGSIVNVISAIRESDTDPDSILVTHDAVRPFVSSRIIEENIDCALKYGATDTCIHSTDTIIRSADGEVIDDIPVRAEIYNGQTPQSFRIGWFIGDFGALSDEQKTVLTDACKIFTLAGRKVHIVEGDSYNMKITTPFDLKLAEAIISEGTEK